MNAHSQRAPMLDCRVFRRPDTTEAHARRGEDILTAAERCFVKSGFHRTTIQNIAAEAGMSVGNVYRYFTSKDAVVEALVGRDQAAMADDFVSLTTDDLMAAFAALMRRQVIECGRGRAILWLEICAEAARNPTIAAVTRAHEQAIAAELEQFFARVVAERARSGSTTAADPQALAKLAITLFSGIMVKQALAPDHSSPDARVDQMFAIVTAALDGRIALDSRHDTRIGVSA